MFPSSHDIVDIPEIKKACFTVLGNLLQADNEVLVTTKPNPSVIKEIINEFDKYRDNIQFRFTITSRYNERLSFWEPNAPNFQDRFESLVLSYNEGFKTSVSIEPFLDNNPVPLVHELASYVTESIWVGPMNHMPRKNIRAEDVKEYDRVREIKRKENLEKIYNALQDFPKIRFKDSMLIKLGLQ